MRIAVITGGATAERAVAFAGAAQIVEALRSRGHTVRVVDTVTGLRSEEHTSELQSHSDLVCRLLLEKKKTKKDYVRKGKLIFCKEAHDVLLHHVHDVVVG